MRRLCGFPEDGQWTPMNSVSTDPVQKKEKIRARMVRMCRRCKSVQWTWLGLSRDVTEHSNAAGSDAMLYSFFYFFLWSSMFVQSIAPSARLVRAFNMFNAIYVRSDSLPPMKSIEILQTSLLGQVQ